MSLFLTCVNGQNIERPPIWFMRQAGRYLTEYRNTRKQAGSFLDLCYNSDLSTQVTLQPIERFGFDAAILFADILLILDANKNICCTNFNLLSFLTWQVFKKFCYG